MRLFLTLLLLTSYIFSSAQINKDSLLILFLDETKETTFRLEAFRQYCTNDFVYENPERSIQLAQIGIDLAKRKQLNNELAFGLFCMGVAHNNLGKTDDAIIFQYQSFKISQEIKDTTMMTKALNNLGNIYLNKSDFGNAIDSYRRCQRLLEEKGNEREVAVCQNNIGLIYYDLEEYEQALEYLNSALNIYQKLGEESSQANTLINIGTVYRLQEKYEKALSFYEQGLELKKKNNIKHGLGTCYSNIGLIYRAKGEENKALAFFKLSLQLHQQMDYKKGIARNFIHIGDWYYATNKDSSFAYASDALSLAQQINYSAEIIDAAELLYKIHESLGNYEEAIKMQTMFRDLRDSMYNLEVHQAVFNNKLKNSQEKKIEGLKEEIRDNQNWNRNMFFLLVGIFSIMLLSLAYYWKKRKKQNVVEREKLLLQIESLKKKLLSQSLASPIGDKKILTLNKAKLEKAINNRLGESSWMILNLIFNNPSISNKEISEEISLSIEGVSSSLRRMYQAFEISTSSNKKITLIMKVTRLSFED